MTAKQSSPAAVRNREPIFRVLERVLPSSGTLLEIASGTGEHAVWMAPRLPGLTWQTSDADAAMRESISAWIAESGVVNVPPPLALDVCTWPWPIQAADAIFCANMIHIAPWAACEGLLRGAGALLSESAPFVLYGPFKLGGSHTSPSNEAFDASLRERDARWGVRDAEAVIEAARPHGLRLDESLSLPANNRALVFLKVYETVRLANPTRASDTSAR